MPPLTLEPPPVVAAPLHLRPMSVGEILDRSFRLYRNHFLKFFLAVFVVQCVAFVLLQMYMAQVVTPFYQAINVPAGRQADFDPSVFLLFGIGSAVFLAATGLLSLVYLGALIPMVSETFLGRSLSLREAYQMAFRRFPALFAVNWLKMLVLGAALLIELVPLALAAAFKAWWVMAFWSVLGLLPALFAYLWLALASIVLMIENLGPVASIKRSGRLMFTLSEKGVLRNNAFRISVLLLVIFAIKSIVMTVSQTPYAAWKAFQVMRDPSLLGHAQRTLLDSAFELINMILQTATIPFGLAMLVVFYFDVRIRKEGFDIAERLRWLRARALVDGESKI